MFGMTAATEDSYFVLLDGDPETPRKRRSPTKRRGNSNLCPNNLRWLANITITKL